MFSASAFPEFGEFSAEDEAEDEDDDDDELEEYELEDCAEGAPLPLHCGVCAPSTLGTTSSQTSWAVSKRHRSRSGLFAIDRPPYR